MVGRTFYLLSFQCVGQIVLGRKQLVETFLGRISWWRHFWGESVGGNIFGENQWVETFWGRISGGEVWGEIQLVNRWRVETVV